MDLILVLDKIDNIYKVKGDKQNFIDRKKNKRAFIAVSSVDLEGNILSTQSILKRVLTTSLPTNKASEKAIKKYHHFRLNKRIY